MLFRKEREVVPRPYQSATASHSMSLPRGVPENLTLIPFRPATPALPFQSQDNGLERKGFTQVLLRVRVPPWNPDFLPYCADLGQLGLPAVSLWGLVSDLAVIKPGRNP